jgi:hypothetical protein
VSTSPGIEAAVEALAEAMSPWVNDALADVRTHHPHLLDLYRERARKALPDIEPLIRQSVEAELGEKLEHERVEASRYQDERNDAEEALERVGDRALKAEKAVETLEREAEEKDQLISGQARLRDKAEKALAEFRERVQEVDASREELIGFRERALRERKAGFDFSRGKAEGLQIGIDVLRSLVVNFKGMGRLDTALQPTGEPDTQPRFTVEEIQERFGLVDTALVFKAAMPPGARGSTINTIIAFRKAVDEAFSQPTGEQESISSVLADQANALATGEQEGEAENCKRCGRGNSVWFAPSPLWNAVMRDGSIDGEPKYNDLVCASCFIHLAEEQGIATHFRVFAEQVNVELETTTPSGCVWDEGRQLWAEPDSQPGKAPASGCTCGHYQADHPKQGPDCQPTREGGSDERS